MELKGKAKQNKDPGKICWFWSKKFFISWLSIISLKSNSTEEFLVPFRKQHVLTYLMSRVFNFPLLSHEIIRINPSIYVI